MTNTNTNTNININTWDIHFNIEHETILLHLNNLDKKLYLLNLEKPVNEYSIVEKIVYDFALFHFNRLNIEINSDIYVEFWFKNIASLENFHVDCDEEKRHKYQVYNHPLLSCVTYFNDHNCPTIITNIDIDTYKYKNFEDQNSFLISFPRKQKQITFDGRFFHGISNFFDNDNYQKERYMLAINLWNKKPINSVYYDANNNIVNNLNIETVITPKEIVSEIINVSKEFINFDLFENLLYKRSSNLFLNFGKFITEDSTCHFFEFIRDDKLQKEIEKQKIHDKLKIKHGDIMDDIKSIMDETNFIRYNRFLQRFSYKQIYTPEICKWIINESELYAKHNGGWLTKRHNNYPTTDLPIDYIKPIFNFIFLSFETITNKIKQSYNLSEEIRLHFADVFIVKYKYNEQSYLDLHHDGSFFSFQILLSNQTDFEGGGTYFDDGLIMNPEQGELIIHSSKMKHAGLPITKGERYLLVGFINLDL